MRTAEGGQPETRLARAGLACGVAVGVPLVVGAGLVVGPAGALGAAVGTALVTLLIGMPGAVARLAAAAGDQAVVAGALVGVGVRLCVYIGVLVALRDVEAVHRPSLAIATAVALVATLAVEMWIVARRPQLTWLRLPAPDREGTGA